MQAVGGCIRNSIRLLASETRHQSSHLPKAIVVSKTQARKMSSTPTYTSDYLSNKLKNELEAEHVDIEDLSNCGCGMKFDALLVSPKFEGKPILQRQRLVNQILAEEMKYIHAFTMRTLTPGQWKESQEKKQQN